MCLMVLPPAVGRGGKGGLASVFLEQDDFRWDQLNNTVALSLSKGV
jgi:hypothetical protein